MKYSDTLREESSRRAQATQQFTAWLFIGVSALSIRIIGRLILQIRLGIHPLSG